MSTKTWHCRCRRTVYAARTRHEQPLIPQRTHRHTVTLSHTYLPQEGSTHWFVVGRRDLTATICQLVELTTHRQPQHAVTPCRRAFALLLAASSAPTVFCGCAGTIGQLRTMVVSLTAGLILPIMKLEQANSVMALIHATMPCSHTAGDC